MSPVAMARLVAAPVVVALAVVYHSAIHSVGIVLGAVGHEDIVLAVMFLDEMS